MRRRDTQAGQGNPKIFSRSLTIAQALGCATVSDAPGDSAAMRMTAIRNRIAGDATLIMRGILTIAQ